MTAQASPAIQRINALSQEQRDAAYNVARGRIAGPEPEAGYEPQLPDYLTQTHGRLPPKAVHAITALCVVMLIAAFIPSAMRLYMIAATLAGLVVTGEWLVRIAAICAVIMAEIGQVIYSLAAATRAETKTQRIAFWAGSIICLAIALVGNGVAEGIHIATNYLAPLLTFAPPILVLITAQVLKSQLLHAVEIRHAATQRYNADHSEWAARYAFAMMEWQTQFANAAYHASWERELANALRDALRSANKASKAVLRELTLSDWHSLILRERSAEEWWDIASQKAASGNTNGNATGEISAMPTTQVDGVFFKHCPICDRKFSGKTSRSAANAVVAHQKSHKEEAVMIYTNGHKEEE